LSLPREIGRSPDDGEPILAGIGRFGPYVKHGKTYASLEDGDDVLTIGINRAVTLIAEKKANPKKGRRFGPDPGKVLGEHPDKGGQVVVKNGRYGPYVSNNGINATLPSDKTPDTVTLTEAVVLLDARAEALGQQPRRAAGRKKAGEASEAPKGRKAKAAADGEKTAKPRKKAAKKKADKVSAAE
jgi:DNA topoisomerase I